MRTPTNVRMFGWIRSATQARDDRRSGNMQIRADEAGEGHESGATMATGSRVIARAKTRSVSHADPRSQGPDRPPARAARRLPVFQRGRRDALRRQGAGRCATASAAIWAPTASARASTRCSTRPQRLEVIVTDSVVEALALENHLIKQRAPRYNILLRDDKNYPYLQLTTSEAFPRVLVARRVERDGHFYAGPFLPASLGAPDDGADAPAVRHPVVQRGDHRRARPAVPRVRHQALHRAVRRATSARRTSTAWRSSTRSCSSKAATTSSSTTLRGPDGRRRPTRERFEEAAQLRDAMRDDRDARATRQQKMATAGARRSRRVRPEGRSGRRGRPGLPDARGRVVERVELVTRRRSGSRADGDVPRCRGAAGRGAAVLRGSRAAAGDSPAARARRSRDAVLEAWLSARAGRRVRLVVPQRGEKRGLLELATRNAALAYQQRFNENTAANYDALETLRVVLALPACRAASSASTSRRFRAARPSRRWSCAKTAGCGRGSIGSSGFGGSGFRARGSGFGAPQQLRSLGDVLEVNDVASAASPEPRAPGSECPAAGITTSRRCTKSSCGATASVLEEGGPFPDLILIDGGKGQLSAAYAALEELGLANLIAVGIAKKEELLFTRDREDAIALPRDEPGAAPHPADSRRGAPLRGDVPSPARGDARSPLGARRVPGIGRARRKALLTAFGSLAGVRRATREELVRVVGAKAADAVLAHFAAHRERRRHAVRRYA